MAEFRTIVIFNFDRVTASRHSVDIVCLNHPQYERSVSAETPGSYPEIPAEIALIIIVSSPKWRQRATAVEEEFGFKQYRVQEVQPSLFVVDSDINSNEYLGVLPYMNMSCYHIQYEAGHWREYSVCVSLWLHGPVCSYICNVRTFVYLIVPVCRCECPPFVWADMSNMQNNR